MNIHKLLPIFLLTLLGARIAAMQQPNLRQQLINAVLEREGNVERVKQLMSAGAPVAAEALFNATMFGSYDVVKTIFECGVDPESPADPNEWYGGETLFGSLVLNKKLQPQVKEKLIKLYVKHGANVELRDHSGSRRFSDVAHSFDFNTLKLLLELGANANAQTKTGKTALMNLAESSSTPAINSEREKMREFNKNAELLIQYGADVNLQDNEGRTSLIYTVIWRENETYGKTFIELLLENDAKVSLKDQEGNSALDYAKDQPEILKLLKDAQKTTGEKS